MKNTFIKLTVRLYKYFYLRFVSDQYERIVHALKFEHPGEIKIAKDKIFFKKFNVEVSKKHAKPLIVNYHLACELESKVNFTFLFDGKLKCKNQFLTIEIQTAEEIFILHEIFFKGCYNFNINETVDVIDIGMNVGIASLYFASKPEVNTVHSYELFPPTYYQALSNFSLNNDSISNKIKAHSFGWGKISRKMLLEYNFENKGQVGFHGTKLIYDSFEKSEHIEVTIKSSIDTLNEIISTSQSDSIIIKLDTEGAEYEIIDSLNPILNHDKLKIIMVEWHLNGPHAISNSLIDAGFKVLSLDIGNLKAGMLYGFK